MKNLEKARQIAEKLEYALRYINDGLKKLEEVAKENKELTTPTLAKIKRAKDELESIDILI